VGRSHQNASGHAGHSVGRDVIPQRHHDESGAKQSQAFRTMVALSPGEKQTARAQQKGRAQEEILDRLGNPANNAGNRRDTEQNGYAKAMYSTSHRDPHGHVIRFNFHIRG